MDLYPGLLVRKIRSGRIAQIAGLDATHVFLTWDDDGKQTQVRRERLNRTTEWESLVGYQEEARDE